MTPPRRGPLDLAGRAAFGAVRTLTRTATAAAADLTSGVARLGEAAADLVGGERTGPATLRVRVLILSDEGGTALTTPAAVQPSLDRADEVLREVGIRVRVTAVDTITEPAPTPALDPRANRALLLDDVLGRTEFYRRHLAVPAKEITLVGAPVTVIVVRDIAGFTTGCSLGINADWVIAQAPLFDAGRPDAYDETVLVHELGHALNLPHHRDVQNLMFPSSSPPDRVRGSDLRPWQGAVLQANRHVLPGVRESGVGPSASRHEE
ncbi:hypothetical protein J2S58_000449 [Nakamurella flavida]|nr:hypothetical protein [Nakamurella flavida]